MTLDEFRQLIFQIPFKKIEPLNLEENEIIGIIKNEYQAGFVVPIEDYQFFRYSDKLMDGNLKYIDILINESSKIIYDIQEKIQYIEFLISRKNYKYCNCFDWDFLDTLLDVLKNISDEHSKQYQKLIRNKIVLEDVVSERINTDLEMSNQYLLYLSDKLNRIKDSGYDENEENISV